MASRYETVASTSPSPDQLHPFPEGWYIVDESKNLHQNQLKERHWLGKDIVYWRDLDGSVCVADAICPHLGANLSPSAGGTIKEGNLVCPFHGFEYGTSGKCVRTLASRPPRSAILKTHTLREVNGFIFAYFGENPAVPRWDLPEFPNQEAHRAVTCVRIKSHPQATSENSVDMAHLGHVHNYSQVKRLADTRVNGPVLTAEYSFTRGLLTRGLRKLRISVEIEINVCGLGISTVAVTSKSGFDAFQWVMATPVDGELIDVWLAVDVNNLPSWYWLKAIPKSLSYGMTAKIFLSDLTLEILKDAEIWSRQEFKRKPAYSAEDKDISTFRKYCEQFYASTSETQVAPKKLDNVRHLDSEMRVANQHL